MTHRKILKLFGCLILCYLLSLVVALSPIIVYDQYTGLRDYFTFALAVYGVIYIVAPVNVLSLWLLFGLKILPIKYLSLLYTVAETILYLVLQGLFGRAVLSSLSGNSLSLFWAALWPYIPILGLTLLAKFAYHNTAQTTPSE